MINKDFLNKDIGNIFLNIIKGKFAINKNYITKMNLYCTVKIKDKI